MKKCKYAIPNKYREMLRRRGYDPVDYVSAKELNYTVFFKKKDGTVTVINKRN